MLVYIQVVNGFIINVVTVINGRKFSIAVNGSNMKCRRFKTPTFGNKTELK
jgi:hypothetical protein